MDRSDARRRFKVVAGGGEIEQLDRFLACTDPVLIASLQTEEQDLRRTKWRRNLLATAVGLALAVPLLLWGSGTRLPGGFAGAGAPDTEKALLLAEEGWKLFAEDRQEEALASFSLATRLAPRLSDAWEGLGICYTEQHQTELAEKAYRRALAIDPNNMDAVDGLGNLYLRRGDEGRAEATWMSGGRDRQLARLYLLQGKFPKAETRLASLLADPHPADDELLYRMAQAARSRRLDNGLRSLLEPEPTGRTHWADKGWSLYKQKRYDEAAAAFGKAISAIPTDVNALGGMGRALLDMGEPREARSYFERALKLDGDHVLSLNGFAHSLEDEGRRDDAIKVWKAMSQRYPGVNIGTPGLAWAYYEKQDYGQAAVHFARLIKRHPYDSRLADALNVAVENIAGPQTH